MLAHGLRFTDNGWWNGSNNKDCLIVGGGPTELPIPRCVPLQHDDPVRMAHGRQTMWERNHRTILTRGERCRQSVLGLRIERAGCVVEQKDPRTANDGVDRVCFVQVLGPQFTPD